MDKWITYLGDKQFIRQNKRYKLDLNGQMHYLTNGFPAYKTTTWEEKIIRKVSKRITDAGKQVTVERVISGLYFGFWTNLLRSLYEGPRTRILLWSNFSLNEWKELSLIMHLINSCAIMR